MSLLLLAACGHDGLALDRADGGTEAAPPVASSDGPPGAPGSDTGTEAPPPDGAPPGEAGTPAPDVATATPDTAPPVDAPTLAPDTAPAAGCPIPCLAALTKVCPVQLPCTRYEWGHGATTCFANGPRLYWGPPMMGPQGVFYGATLRSADGKVCYMIEQDPTNQQAPFTYRDAAGSMVGRGVRNPDGTLKVTCADGQVYEAPASLECPGPIGPAVMCTGGPVCG